MDEKNIANMYQELTGITGKLLTAVDKIGDIALRSFDDRKEERKQQQEHDLKVIKIVAVTIVLCVLIASISFGIVKQYEIKNMYDYDFKAENINKNENTNKGGMN